MRSGMLVRILTEVEEDGRSGSIAQTLGDKQMQGAGNTKSFRSAVHYSGSWGKERKKGKLNEIKEEIG